MSISTEQAAEWFATMHPPGPSAREMYRMAAQALRARLVVEQSLSPRESFSSNDEYIAYLIGVIRNLETARGNLRELVAQLENNHPDEKTHGKWILETDMPNQYQECSACGFRLSAVAMDEILGNTVEIMLYPYCPNCGARMDGEAQNAV